MSGNRRPVVVLVVLGVLVVLVFVVGVTLGGGQGGAGGWRDRLAGLGGAGELAVDDLALGAGCGVDGAAIVFSQTCTVGVAPRGGGLSLGAPVRSATLVNVGSAPVEVEMVVEGERISTDLAPADADDSDDEAGLTFGPEGGAVAMTCRSLAGCAVAVG